MLNKYITVACLSLSPGAVLSQTQPLDDLENVVVTASRLPVEANQIGSSYTVLDREHLERRQLPAVSEVLRDVPGLSVNRGGVLGSATQVRIRGAEGNQVLVLIDGVEANDLAQGGEFNFAHLTTANIERIEVIRGPQSALWGSDALSGVISITTKKGRQSPSISAYSEGGSFGTFNGGGSISGGAENYHFNLAGSYIDSDGVNISRDGNEDDAYENGTLSLTAGYSPLDNFQVDSVFRMTEAKNEFDGTSFVTGLPADADNETETSQYFGRIQGRLLLLDDRLLNQFGASITSTDNDNFAGGVETSSTQGRKYKFDLQSTFSFSTNQAIAGNHALTVAVEHEIDEFTQRGAVAFGNDPNQDLDIENTGIVAEYRLATQNNLGISASVRHDHNSDFRDITTWKLNATYFFEDLGLRLNGGYGTGSKNPTFTERFGFFASSAFFPFIGNPDLKPETSSAWEVGISKSFMDEKFELGLTYFNEELEDEINGFFFDLATFSTTAINETGKSDREGIELTSRLQLTESIHLDANYTWLDAKQPAPAGGFEREVRRPEHIATVNLRYDFMDDRAQLDLNVNYNGKQDDFFFPPPLFGRQTVQLDSFALVNLAASYRLNKNISLYGRLENMLDENYEEVLGFQSPGFAAFAGVKIQINP